MNINMLRYLAGQLCKKYGIEPDLVDIDALLDSTLTWAENKRIILKALQEQHNISTILDEDIEALEEDFNNQQEDYINNMFSDDERLSRWLNVVEYPSVGIIFGKRGFGKSALGWFLLDYLSRKYNTDAYILGLPAQKYHLVPAHIGKLTMNNISNLPENCVIFVDEGALHFYAREWHKDTHKIIDKMLSISRHKKQILIMATHYPRKLDINIITDSDFLLFKKPSRMHIMYGHRGELRSLFLKVERRFEGLPNDAQKRYVYAISDNFEGMLENPLPSFWSEELSNSFSSINILEDTAEVSRPMHTHPHISDIKIFNDKIIILLRHPADTVYLEKLRNHFHLWRASATFIPDDEPSIITLTPIKDAERKFSFVLQISYITQRQLYDNTLTEI